MSATQTIPAVVPVAPVVSVAPVATVATVAPVTPGRRPTKAHKNPDFVCLSLKKVDSLNTSYYVYLSNVTKR